MDKFRNLKECRDNSAIYNTYYNENIDDEIVYIESRNGFDFTGNLFRIAEEISTGKYGDFKIYVFVQSHVKPKIEDYKKNYTLNIHKVIDSETEAVRIMHRAKYIFTDSGIRYKYVKKPGQIFTNTWHGTIMKLMGHDNSHERPTMGIIQRSLLFSDYLIMPSDYMKYKLLDSFMLDEVFPGKILLEGYPRNSVFLDVQKRDEFREMFGLKNHEIFIYMPTFKGLVDDRKDEKQKDEVSVFLDEIDEHLNDNQILFAKLHPYNTQKIDYTKFNHIIPFPEGFEIYDIVNMADCLISDYSSVFFDFANTRQKVILFNYDEKEYLKDRGLYFPLSDLPFPKVQTVVDLINEMNAPKNYDDEEFIEKFCQYDRIDAVEHICKSIFNGENSCKYEIIENEKPNVLLYAGDFSNTQSADNFNTFINQIDCNKYNLFLSFCPWMENMKLNNEGILDSIPECVCLLPFSYNILPTVKEKLKYDKLVGNASESEYDSLMIDFFRRSFNLQYGGLDFDCIISFDSSDFNQNLIFDNGCENFYLLGGSGSDVENLIEADEIHDNLEELIDSFSKLI